MTDTDSPAYRWARQREAQERTEALELAELVRNGRMWREKGDGMTTFYMVTDGHESDFCGIYSTPEKAEQAKLLFDSSNEVEQIELDAMPVAPAGMLPWRVVMDTAFQTMESRRASAFMFAPKWHPSEFSDAFFFYVWARDEEHAVQVANETRLDLMAKGEWTTDYKVWRERKTTPGHPPSPTP